MYAERDKQGLKNRYTWHQPDVRYQEAIKWRMLSTALRMAIGENIADKSWLDVGCGSGSFLRLLVEWGAAPDKLLGTEFLDDRLERARTISPAGIRWHLGGLDFDGGDGFDLVSAHTVFSSVLDNGERQELANAMWEKVRPGGWLLIFDFRYNNPRNPNVRKVTQKELEKWWPASDRLFCTGLLAPPLARLLIKQNYILAEILTSIFPFLRSHFVFMARK